MTGKTTEAVAGLRKELGQGAIRELAALYPTFGGEELEFDSSDYPQEAVAEAQLTMGLAETPPPYKTRKGKTGEAGHR